LNAKYLLGPFVLDCNWEKLMPNPGRPVDISRASCCRHIAETH
jgi:hypothetical protein